MQDLQSALAVVRRAIHDEIAGQRFYNEVALRCIDPWAKAVFADLTREEEAHTRLLLLEYESLTTQGRWIDPEIAMASGSDVDITRFTFPDTQPAEELFLPEWSAEGVIDRRVDDVAALAFGIRMEERAISLYSQSAEETDDPVARQAYGFLIDEEVRHYHQLSKQWERLAGLAFEEED